MNYTPQTLGLKLYGVYEFSRVGLFNRPFVILAEAKSKERLLEKLRSAGFRDHQEVAIRFSKGNVMNLPVYMGKFTLEKVVSLIQKNRKDLVPFVHGLVKTKFSVGLYYDGRTIFLELRPGVGASQNKMRNENSDMIKIADSISIARYRKQRTVADVTGRTIHSKPFDFNFLMTVAKKIRSLKNKLNSLLAIQNPLLCVLNCESTDDLNFMGIQKTAVFDPWKIDRSTERYHIVKSLEDLKKYHGSERLFFDIPLNRDHQDWITIVKILKKFPKVYVKSLTMHLAVILRESGIKVEKGMINDEYEIKNIDI